MTINRILQAFGLSILALIGAIVLNTVNMESRQDARVSEAQLRGGQPSPRGGAIGGLEFSNRCAVDRATVGG